MTRKPPRPPKDKTADKSTSNRDVTVAEDDLWAYVLRDVVPLPGRHKPGALAGKPQTAPPTAPSANRPPAPPQRADTSVLPPKSTVDLAASRSPGSGMDRRNEDRLRRGKMEIDATLDLHGLRQAEAHARLNQFILQSHRAGRRCLLVITGKGRGVYHSDNAFDGPEWMRSEPGILRQQLPRWIQQEPLRSIVLDMAPAQGRDGGSGAFYILLRRVR